MTVRTAFIACLLHGRHDLYASGKDTATIALFADDLPLLNAVADLHVDFRDVAVCKLIVLERGFAEGINRGGAVRGGVLGSPV